MKPAINLNGVSESFKVNPEGGEAATDSVCSTAAASSRSPREAGGFVVERDKDGIPAIVSNVEGASQRLREARGNAVRCRVLASCTIPRSTARLVAFVSGRGMFYQGALGNSLGGRDAFRVERIRYNPQVPKLRTRKQSKYYSTVSQYTLALSIPKTVADPETVGACLDYLEWASFTECIPVVQDALCYKGVRDDDLDRDARYHPEDAVYRHGRDLRLGRLNS